MELTQAIAEVQQPRSRYMLETMTFGVHDTPEMRFYYCVIELNDKLHKYQLAEVTKNRMEREMGRLEESDDLDADLDLREKRIEYDFLMGVMAGGKRELDDLLDIYEGMQHFTREEIDANQREYWEARMTRQTQLQIMAGGVQWSQLDAMRQVGLLDDLVAENQPELMSANGSDGL
tara:strand:- start:353 stop:880 length:528 start_codon:yes stop_codon:yes gene_type:complete